MSCPAKGWYVEKQRQQEYRGLSAYLSPVAVWSFALGTSIGWGSLVLTSSSHLAQGGPVGSVLGMLVGLAIMLVIGSNYSFLMHRRSDAGGIYAYAASGFGHDAGFITAWFLGLTYAAMLWANATSLPLFARYFLGNTFQVGFRYQVFGYEVYLVEAMISVLALLLVALLCIRGKRAAAHLMVGFAGLFTVIILVTFAVALAKASPQVRSLEPTFVPGSSPIKQVLLIACMSPWAFIGFESISHSSEEFAFSTKRIPRIMTSALVVVTLLYCSIIVLSALAYPAGCENWLAYIANRTLYQGTQGLPAFNAARTYMGDTGVTLLAAALLALIISSLVGNIVALSRLVYALARDSVLPARYGVLNEHSVPANAIKLIVGISLIVPLFGRTAIGWIVDVTTVGATLSYGFVSACVLRRAREIGDTRACITGALGIVLMVALGVQQVVPGIMGKGSLAPESYFLFTVWAILGFVYFRAILRADSEHRFGKSVVVWVALLALVLFTSLTWMGQDIQNRTDGAIQEVQECLRQEASDRKAKRVREESLEAIMDGLQDSVARDISVVAALFALSLGVMMSNFAIIRRREEESERQLRETRAIANTDPLTGVKSKHAYAAREQEMNELLAAGALGEMALVVCDVNGLKQVNDTLGHKAGDEYIRSASLMICHLFKHSPVFRIGGDEFVVILTGHDFELRDQLMAELNEKVERNLREGKVVVAGGMSDYVAGQDRTIGAVFDRADTLMYQRKKELKQGV